MKLSFKNQKTRCIKIELTQGREKIGRAFLYLIKNDLHKRPYGLMEDVFVAKEHRGQGLGTKLIREIFKVAKKNKCYKLIATSRAENKSVHRLYQKLGFKKHGVEFRINF